VSQVFAGFHHSSTQRAIRRAEREGVTCDTGSSDELLQDFFSLLRMSRRRHGLPPQPISWFRNLRRTMGERMVVRVARYRGLAVAAVLTLTAGRGVVYKYGGSDAAHHALGAMPFLFWQVIQAAKDAGAAELDLGRSDLDQPGLITFKDHLGAKQSIVTYYGQTAHRTSLLRQAWVSRTSGRVVSALPNMALDLAGRLLYRRMG
jgi:lipid II:glycine glycyltransferase (peptidoglycan interpeptide bridge formation enzyme)